ncbi:MAG: DUF5714 domain-containing protein [Oscillospiraceae bacterium]
MANHKNNCMVCGKPLIYHDSAEDMTCMICGGAFPSNAACEAGHFVCDSCHSAGSVAFILKVARETTLTDPVAIAREMMAQPKVHMHGPEHHTLVPAALLAAYHNAGGEIDLERALRVAAQRGAQVPGGICGFWGSCGSAIGAGIFVSIVAGASPLSKEPWGLANSATAQCLARIARYGGPRCCKRNGLLAILEASRFAKEHFGVDMAPGKVAACTYHADNSECLGARCPFHPR